MKLIDNPALQGNFIGGIKKLIRFVRTSDGWIRLMMLALETMDAKV